ncbi:PqqD family protein [Sphingomicrobium aestuariivivum]|uniref:PqqD family protein n=1 Tax=Sphingomicrobium aestuariivivum TaxID=1582356 RepID=UPI001FD6E1BA|nr:PqqD family protein [Sphingomicrobium aestuariivivum]MCJ8191368.1 PqqD family protein [Sphingomicrobium aestuariivivum]
MAKAPPLTPETRIRRNETIPTGRVDGELMALDPRAGDVFGLDPIATLLWDRIGGGTTVAALVEAMVADHDVSPEQCLADILPFLEQAREAGLVIVEA